MKFCIKCGRELPDDAAFCLGCGTPMPDTEAGAGPGGSPAATSGAKTGQTGSGFQTELRPGPGYGTDLENLPEGFVLDDRYEVKEKVGHGGFGAVYRAYDRKMDIDKALKVFPRIVAEDKRSLESLLGEARTMAKLNHPHIVRLYEIHDNGPVKYLAMEYVGGGSLADRLFAADNQRFSEEETKKIGLQIAAGLAYAHSQGVIHKDIKPQNILIANDGTAKVMDFGISETVRTSLSRLSNTTSSGTLVYMSPEQIRGKDVGKEADIYSFGAMLYELLCGHPPFHKGAIEHQILNEAPEPIAGVAEEMNAFLLKCLEKEYVNRCRTFEEATAVLKGEELRASAVVPSTPPQSVEATPLSLASLQEETTATIFEKKVFTNDFGMEFIWISPGSFQMGSPESELGRQDNEKQSTVNLSAGFYMQTTAVTQGQWMAVMTKNPSFFKGRGENCPVEKVSWHDVQKFIRKLNKKTKQNYRLPSEIEWEYACRAGSSSKFHFGDSDTDLDDYAWYYDNSGGAPHAVAQKKPNVWGLYDMHGNVYEWCANWLVEAGRSPTRRVFRGGCWQHGPRACRSANRSGYIPGGRYPFLGFRLVYAQHDK